MYTPPILEKAIFVFFDNNTWLSKIMKSLPNEFFIISETILIGRSIGLVIYLMKLIKTNKKMNTQLRKMSEERKNNKEDFRPISASIKQPSLYKYYNNKNPGKNEFPNLFANLKSINEGNKKFPNTVSEKVKLRNKLQERFYDENINLKTIINNLKKENSILKSEIHKLEVHMYL